MRGWLGALYSQTLMEFQRDAWLLSQALCVALYLAGVIMMFNAERHALNTISN